MAELAAILFSMILVNNFVLVKFLGICPFLGVSRRLDSACGMGAAVTLVMVLSTALTWPLQQLLDAWGLGYLQTIAFILVIATLVQLLEMGIKRFLPPLHESLGVYLPLITTNCAVLGVAILTISEGYPYPQALVAALGAGLGFLLAMVLYFDPSEMKVRVRNAVLYAVLFSVFLYLFFGKLLGVLLPAGILHGLLG